VGERRGGGVPRPSRRLSGAPSYLAELERALDALPGASVDRRSGYLAVTLEIDGVPPGLSERAAALVAAFPESDGRRTLHVDVRNRHWAALVAEIASAVRAQR
jgi:hypothetical protein